MKNTGFVLMIFLFCSSYFYAEIVHHSHIDALYQYVEKYAYKQKIYLFFDIDDTILNTAASCQETVEPNTKMIIDDLKNRGISVYGLTARSIIHSIHTDRQLAFVDIAFDHFMNAPCLMGTKDIGYSNGIFYCGRMPKGYIIKQLFHTSANDSSIAIIFIDDMYHDSVHIAAQELNIDCTFIHYTYAAEFIHVS